MFLPAPLEGSEKAPAAAQEPESKAASAGLDAELLAMTDVVTEDEGPEAADVTGELPWPAPSVCVHASACSVGACPRACPCASAPCSGGAWRGPRESSWVLPSPHAQCHAGICAVPVFTVTGFGP